MNKRELAIVMLATREAAMLCQAQPLPERPTSFPTFQMQGQDRYAELLTDLFWRHYSTGRKGCTLWQEWMTLSALWPATPAGGDAKLDYRGWHRNFLLNAHIDSEGYVATHQHASLAHQDGWPFPDFRQSRGTATGWLFDDESKLGGWVLTNCQSKGIVDKSWHVVTTGRGPMLTSPPVKIDSFNSPFLQLRWRSTHPLGRDAVVEWTTADEPDFSPERRMRFAGVGASPTTYTMIPVHRHPGWQGQITQLRLSLSPDAAQGEVFIEAFFCQYDTRHTVNNSNFIIGCWNYFLWTGDLPFLRQSINRMRRAMRYMQRILGGAEHKCILTPFVGHDGRGGYEGPPGQRQWRPGHGIGGNYWDLLPFGHFDCYATNLYYKSLLVLADVEEAAAEHPEWSLPGGALAFDPQQLRRHAAEVRQASSQRFWNPETGRFVACIDADGKPHDFGFTFLNLEAIYYGLADERQARQILDWITGKRIVEGDTATGADIYHWRFAPRATTRRNVEWYGWYWPTPENIPWGGQVQDGGAVLGFSYHDLMARLEHLGPDDAWKRLTEILDWYAEVQAAGGYRAYYKDGKRGTLQGGGPPGGLGMDHEFIESILVPQVMLYGFFGFEPQADGFALCPRLPAACPEMAINNINLRGIEINLSADALTINLAAAGPPESRVRVFLPQGRWVKIAGRRRTPLSAAEMNNGVSIATGAKITVRFERGGSE